MANLIYSNFSFSILNVRKDSISVTTDTGITYSEEIENSGNSNQKNIYNQI